MSPQRLAQYAVRGFDKVKRRKSLWKVCTITKKIT
jgi:hypothetical protein